MAITRSFGGQTLLKPGAYSVSRIDNAQSLATGDNDTIMLIGEAVNGNASVSAGGEGTARMFTASQVQGLIDYYGSGDIVDAALAAVRPSITPGVSGPGIFIVYKTNVGAVATQQLRFETAVENAAGFPVAGDVVRFRVPVNASGEMTDVNLVYGSDILGFVAGNSVTTDQDTNSSVLAAAINASPALQNFVTAVAQGNQVNLTAVKQGPEFGNGTSGITIFNLNSLGVNKEFLRFGSTAANPVTIAGAVLGADAGDAGGFAIVAGASNLGATTTSQLNEAYADAFNFDPNVIVPLWSNADVAPTSARSRADFTVSGDNAGAATTAVINLTNGNGASGAITLSFTPAGTANTDYAAAFVAAWNLSTDARLAEYAATDAGSGEIDIIAEADGSIFDISVLTIGVAAADTTAGTTISTPVLTAAVRTPVAAGNPNAGTIFLNINAIIAASGLQSHLIERSSTSVRKEAQGMIGGRFLDWQSSFNNSVFGFGGITSFLIQAFIQDVRVFDSQGMLSWKAPHILAAQAAGIRLGTTVGEPLTFKFVNANNIAHHVNTETGNFSGSVQFKPGFDFNVAILNGITFTEIASGGNRIVVDNTRYTVDDQSFVFNRGSVIEAAQFVARTSRILLERIFVGQKVSNGAALSLKNVLRNYLIQLNTDNIITSSSDAPFGFVEETFTVTINGNTAAIQVEIKPVQGLDFIFIDFTLGNITQQA